LRFLNANKMTTEELKQQIIDATYDATDLDDNTISYTILDMMLDDILDEFLNSNQAE